MFLFLCNSFFFFFFRINDFDNTNLNMNFGKIIELKVKNIEYCIIKCIGFNLIIVENEIGPKTKEQNISLFM